VKDVSRNGTTLNGVVLSAALAIREPLTLKLGGEVVLRLEPDPEFCLRVEWLEEVLFAPLGDIECAVGRLDWTHDGWLELVPGNDEIYLGELRVVQPVQLCRGDCVSLARGGPAVVRVEA
jgi:hypothetical protein